jgi:hypothetical protein
LGIFDVDDIGARGVHDVLATANSFVVRAIGEEFGFDEFEPLCRAVKLGEIAVLLGLRQTADGAADAIAPCQKVLHEGRGNEAGRASYANGTIGDGVHHGLR